MGRQISNQTQTSTSIIQKMKFLALSTALLASLAFSQQTCKPSIEPNTPGIQYEKLVDRFMDAKRSLDQIEKTENAIAEVEEIILSKGNDGLDAIMEEVRKLSLELVVKPSN